MKVVSSIYNRFFYKDYNDKKYVELESQGFEDYIKGLEDENKDLKLEVKRYKQGYLNTENDLLKEKVEKLENLLSESMQENYFLSDRIEELEQDSEINKRLETDEDFYNTKDLDNKQCFDTIDKLTDERNTYKEVINVMCDKFNIEHDEAINIIDDIQNSKDNQLEKEFI